MQKTLEYFAQNDLFPSIAWVLADNTPARRFYEKLGGVVVQEKIEKIGNHDYTEVAYAFNCNENILRVYFGERFSL
jgi:hypothetical protein